MSRIDEFQCDFHKHSAGKSSYYVENYLFEELGSNNMNLTTRIWVFMSPHKFDLGDIGYNEKKIWLNTHVKAAKQIVTILQST